MRSTDEGFEAGSKAGGCFDHGTRTGREREKTTPRFAEKTSEREIMQRSDERRIANGRGFRRSLC
jgi:hypothetical protein